MPGFGQFGIANVKADCAAIGRRRWLAVVGYGHDEAAAVVRVGQPALARLGAGLPADRGKQRIVKLLRPGDVVAPDHYVAELDFPPGTGGFANEPRRPRREGWRRGEPDGASRGSSRRRR